MIVYFHFLYYKLFLQKQLFTGDFQNNCSEKLSKSNRKKLVMETFFCEVGDCNFTIKGLYKKLFRVNFDKVFIFFKEYLQANDFVPFRLLWDFTSILKAIEVLHPLHFDSCPVMIRLTKQMNVLPNASFKGVLWNSWAEKSRNIPKKMSLIKPCFNNIILELSQE